MGFNPRSTSTSTSNNVQSQGHSLGQSTHSSSQQRISQLSQSQTQSQSGQSEQPKMSRRSSSEAVLQPREKDPLSKLGQGSFVMDIKKTSVSKGKGQVTTTSSPSVRKT